MSDEIFFDGRRYISANEAASSSDLTRDYIARLCRDGRVVGRRIGKNWYVDHASLKTFLITQEFAKSTRSESLTRERVREYHKDAESQFIKNTPSPGTPSVPVKAAVFPAAPYVSRVISGRTDEIKNKLAAAVAAQSLGDVKSKVLFSAPGGFAHAALSAAHVPVYTLSPITEFFHKVVALALALMLTFGTYAAVDPAYAQFAANSVRENVQGALDSYRSATGGGLTELAARTQSQVAAAAEHPQAAVASVGSVFTDGLPHLAARFARAVHSQVNDLVYAVAFPLELVGSRSTASSNQKGSVVVGVAPYTPSTAEKSQITNLANSKQAPVSKGNQTIINNPVYPERVERVVERIVETTRLVSAGGISEEILDRKLAALDAKLSSQVFTSSAAQTTNVTNVYAAAASVGRIEHLDLLDLTNPVITGGSITSASISDADSLSVVGTSTLGVLSAGSTSLATTTVTGDLTATGALSSASFTVTNFTAVNGTTTNATSTNFFATNASTTNSTSTNLYSSSLVAGNATSTNLFSTFARFTTGIIDTFTSTLATITDLVATNLTATNATTTNATSTNAFSTNLVATNATVTGLNVTNSTTTNATSTNLYASKAAFDAATSTNLFSTTASSTNLFSTNGNISVLSAGTLNLTGLASFTQASTTRLSVFDKAYFGGSATSTFDSAGNLFAAGTVGVGASSIDASAVFQIDSIAKGFLGPRLTTAQKNAIASPAAGLTLYDSTLNKLNVYNGSAWKNVGSTEIGGEVTSGTTGSVLFIGDGTVLGQDNANFSYSTSTNRLLTTQASTTRLSVFDRAYFGGSATSTFDSAGNLSVAGTLGVTGNTTLANATSTSLFSTTASSTNLFSTNGTVSALTAGTLTLTNDLAVAQGGTGASTLTGLLQGNGTSAFTAITDSSTAGQLLRVTGASTYAWGALDLADTDAVTGDLPFANLAQVAANSVLGNITGSTGDAASIATSSLFTWTGTGDVVRATSPTLVTPALGTPSALVGTNITGTGASFTAGAATVLATARNINGTSFNGSADITVTAASSTLLANSNTFSGSNIFSSPLSLTGTTGTTTIAAGQGFTIGGTQFVLQGATGRVGIGTASPSTGLDIGVATKISGDLTLSGGGSLTISASGPVNQTGTGQVTFAGNLDATNGLDVTNANLTVGGSNFTVAHGTGNTTVAGTLGLTGAFNASSTLQATGAARLYSTLQTDGALTAAAVGTGLSVTNNASIGGTLALTGAGTFGSTLAITGVLTAATSTFLGDVALSGKKITGVATPAADTDAANKTYVDSVAQGLSLKDSVRAGTTANITLSGEQTIDGVSLVVGNRVLVKDQTDQTKNGIYVVASGAWSRSTDADANSEVTSGMFSFITEGTLNANSGWVLTTTGAITLGTSLLTFTQFSGAGQITAGTGITKSGNTLDVVGTANRITANADTIDIASTYIGQTSITTVGTLTSGSLGSGFGNINIGASSITGGVATFSSIVGSAINGTGDLTISGSGTFSNALSVVGTLTAATTTFSGDVALGGKKITGLANPTSAQEAATKSYVDAIAQGLTVKASVRVATTTNITLSGTQTIDGVSAIAGDRVLVMGQSTASQNGLYVVAAGAWSRSTDANENSEVVSGMYTFVTAGTAYANTGWSLITPNVITLDTTALTFTQFSGSAETTAGDGLTKSGNTINAVGTANRISVTADAIDISSSYAGQSSLTTVGSLTSGSIGSGFGSINIGSSALTAGTSIFQSATSYGTLSIGGTATTSIVGNSATSTFSGGLSLAAGNVNVATGNGFFINNASILNATTLGSSVLASSLTSVGGLDAGSITTGFGAINIGADTLDAGATVLASLTVSGNTTLANATSTNLFSTTASSTNLFSTNGTVSALTAGTLTLTNDLAVAQGGTGASTLTGLLQGNGTGAITGITGTAGQFPYYNDTNTLLATSSLFLATSGNVGIGTTTPVAPLNVHSASLDRGALFGNAFSITPDVTTGSRNGAYLSVNSYVQSGGFSAVDSAVGSWVIQPLGTNTDTNSGIGLRYRNAGTAITTSPTTVAKFFNTGGLSLGATAATVNPPTGGLLVDGNVGIGTTTPWGKLSVTGAGTGTGVNFLLADSANTPIFKVLDNGSITATGAFTSTSGSPNTLPYASSTALTVAGHCVTRDTRLRRRRRREDVFGDDFDGFDDEPEPEMENATLADGVSLDVSHLVGRTRVVRDSVATPRWMSSEENGTGENASVQPPRGIEPLGHRMTTPVPRQAGGLRTVYHEGKRYLVDSTFVYDEPEIVDIEEGDEIQSLDEKTGELVWSRVRKLMFMGVKQTYRIVTEDGRTIRTTAEHPYLVKNAKGKWLKHRSALRNLELGTWNLENSAPAAGWATVANLREGDEIAVVGSGNHSSRTSTVSEDISTSRFEMSSIGNISARNASNRSRWNANIVGRILRTIRPGVRASGNFAVSRKSVSKVSIGSFSFFERANSTSSGVPFGDHTTSWPRAIATRVSGRDMFSSAKNFTIGGRETDNSVALCSGCRELQSGFDMLAGDGRPRVKNGLESLAVGEGVQNLPNHNARSGEREFSSGNLRVGDDVFVDDGTLHNANSVAQGAMKNQWSKKNLELRTRNLEKSKLQAPSSKLSREARYAGWATVANLREGDEIAVASNVAVSGLAMLDVENLHDRSALQLHLHSVGTNLHTKAIISPLQLLYVPVLQWMSKLLQSVNLLKNSKTRVLGNAQEFLFRLGVERNNKHESYFALLARFLTSAYGIQELALSASAIRLSSSSIASGEESSIKSTMSPKISLEMRPRAATTPRKFLSSMMVMSDALLMSASVAQGAMKNQWSAAREARGAEKGMQWAKYSETENTALAGSVPAVSVMLPGSSPMQMHRTLENIAQNEIAALAGGDSRLPAPKDSDRVRLGVTGTVANPGWMSSEEETSVENAFYFEAGEGNRTPRSRNTKSVSAPGLRLQPSYHEVQMKNVIGWVKIASIEPVAEEDVYDIEVEGTHNFVGNGIVAHNTYLGTVSASGLATLGQASTTLFSSYGPAYFGATATSSFATNGALTLVNALTYGGVTLSNAVTGTGNMVLSESPTFTGTVNAVNVTTSGTVNANAYQIQGSNLATASGATLSFASGAGFDINMGSIAKVNTISGATTFNQAVTSTGLLTATNGLLSQASSTIGSGTQTGGLTISGGATTTGNLVLSATTGTTTAGVGQGLNWGTNYLVVQGATGNVGIGTASPGKALDVTTGTNLDGIRINGSGVNTTFTINNTGTGGVAWGITSTGGGHGAGNGKLLFEVAGSSNSDFVLDNSTHNAGVGTTTPWGKLSVTGAGTGTGVNFLLANSANTPIFKVLDDGTATLTGSLTASALSAFSGGLTAYASSTIGNGTQAGGLTISGGATTTGNAYFAGNVGIGTAAPASKLEVGTNGTGAASDSVYLSSSNSAGLVLSTAGPYYGSLYSTGVGGVSSSLNIGFNGSATAKPTTALMTVVSSGNVGIGTSTPGHHLTIAPTNRTDANNVLDNSEVLIGTSVGSAFGMRQRGASAGISGTEYAWQMMTKGSLPIELYTADATDLVLGTNATDRLHITSTGNVGIGTTSPMEMFTVAGGRGLISHESSLAFVVEKANGTNVLTVDTVGSSVTVGGNIIIPSAAGNWIGSGATDGLTLDASANAVLNASSGLYFNLDANATGGVGDFVVGKDRSSTSGGTEFFRILESTGLVGIGTSTPSGNLVINGTTGQNLFQIASSTNQNILVVNQNGSVGIGTTPTSKLTIAAPGAGNVAFNIPAENTNTGFQIERSAANTTRLTWYGSGNGVVGSISDSSGITASGPWEFHPLSAAETPVSIIGFSSQAADYFSIGLTSGTLGQTFVVRASGSVGIGTSTPFSKLTVATGDIGAFNGAVCADNGGVSKCYGALTAGVVYGDSSSFTASDVAEMYPTSDTTLAAGEVVALDTSASTMVKRASPGERAFGIVSTAPGVLLGDETRLGVPVALAGRVPVRVNLEGGTIAVGDAIALSSVAGVGAKATTTAYTLGIALEPYTGTGTSTIQVFVKHELTLAGMHVQALSEMAAFASSTDTTTAAGSFMDGFFHNLFARVSQWLADAGNGISDFFAGKVHTRELCVGESGNETCVTKAQLDALLAGSTPSTDSGQASSQQAGAAGAAGSVNSLQSTVDSSSNTNTTTSSSSTVNRQPSTVNSDSEAPVLTLNGENPATIQTGATYADMGVEATDNHDIVLYIYASVDGGPTFQPGETVTLDTTEAGDHTIVFTVTDEAGNSATATRTVHVVTPEAAPTPDPEPEPAPEPTPVAAEPASEPTAEPAPSPVE